ncbi:unnamed protein product, partial [Musa acuminata var. zebrina]
GASGAGQARGGGGPVPGGAPSRPPRRPCNQLAQSPGARRRPGRQSCVSDTAARVPCYRRSGNREVLRRALYPPTHRRNPALCLRRWTFRPSPSPLSKMSLE